MGIDLFSVSFSILQSFLFDNAKNVTKYLAPSSQIEFSTYKMVQISWAGSKNKV